MRSTPRLIAQRYAVRRWLNHPKSTMAYTIVDDGDDFERLAWASFLRADFPAATETFWQRHIVPLTNRPADIQLKDDATLQTEGKGHEDLAIAQLHYTVLKHLVRAHQIRSSGTLDDLRVVHWSLRPGWRSGRSL